MKVFISWSGETSRECAELLSNWIKCTLQATEPWISSQDIDKGTIWFNEISNELKETKVGIVCLTKKNKEKPWILFESGALAKGITANKVCTFLIDLKEADIKDPLAQFNHTLPNENGLRRLLATINKELGEKALDQEILNQVFDTYWNSFSEDFNKIIDSISTEVVEEPIRSENEILEEILHTTRKMDRRISSLEINQYENNSNIMQKSFFDDTENIEIQAHVRKLVKLGVSTKDIIDNLKNRQIPVRNILDLISKIKKTDAFQSEYRLKNGKHEEQGKIN